MTLSEAQKKFLRGLGHQLKPVILIGGSGLSASVLEELNSSISHHELIKVRVRNGDRKCRDATIENMCNKSGASLVARIGNIALIYRRNADQPRIRLPAT